MSIVQLSLKISDSFPHRKNICSSNGAFSGICLIMVQMRVAKCPTDVLSLKNRVIVNPADQANLLHGAKHVSITTGPGQRFVFSLEPSPEVNPGTLGFSTPQRKWAVLSLNQGGFNSPGLL